MPDTTYQYTFSDNLSNGTGAGAETGTISGTFTADYNTLLASGMVTVTTPEGTENFTITNANISDGPGDPNQFTLNDLSPDQSRISLTYTSMTPSEFDFGNFQTSKANVAEYSLVTPAPVISSNTTACFCTGTLIATEQGNIAVEEISIGDVIITTSHERRRVKWIGHRETDIRHHPRPNEVRPIRIAAHAFAEYRPARDLYVSPGHAICVDLIGEMLIPAGALVNGSTILQTEAESVTYWHVELDGGHDIILAENLPCESYLDMGNRSFFAEAEATALHASPDVQVMTHAAFCRPFHQDGSVVAFVRERLAARSPDLGWTLKEEPFANIHLIVDGQRVEAVTNDLSARFVVPATARDVWLCSDTSVPAEIGIAPDLRSLGVCVGSIVIDDGFGAPSTIFADDPLLSAGFHDIEEGPQRWTAGRSRLPVELWKCRKESFFLRVELTRPALPMWIAPDRRVHSNLLKLVG